MLCPTGAISEKMAWNLFLLRPSVHNSLLWIACHISYAIVGVFHNAVCSQWCMNWSPWYHPFLLMHRMGSAPNSPLWAFKKLLLYHRGDSRFAPSQWETALLCNGVSHWLGASLESVLYWVLVMNYIDKRIIYQGPFWVWAQAMRDDITM